jgi:hypothetical protein
MRYKYHTIKVYSFLRGQPVRALLRACQSCPLARQMSAQTIRGNFSQCPILLEVRSAASRPYGLAHPAISPNLVSVRFSPHADSSSELTCHPNPLASSLAPASASPWKNRSRDPSLKPPVSPACCFTNSFPVDQQPRTSPWDPLDERCEWMHLFKHQIGRLVLSLRQGDRDES